MENKYEVSFELILNAGNSKSKSLMAIECAREFDFQEAEKLVNEAAVDLKAAHKSQTDMIQGEARGESQEINVILIHAQDHLMTAIEAKTLIENIIKLHKKIEGK